MRNRLLRIFFAVLGYATSISVRFAARLDIRLRGYRDVFTAGLRIIGPDAFTDRMSRIWNSIAEQDRRISASVKSGPRFSIWYGRGHRVDLSMVGFFSITDRMLALPDQYLEGYLIYFAYAVLSVKRGLAAARDTPREFRNIIGRRARRLTASWLTRRGKDPRVIEMFRPNR